MKSSEDNDFSELPPALELQKQGALRIINKKGVKISPEFERICYEREKLINSELIKTKEFKKAEKSAIEGVNLYEKFKSDVSHYDDGRILLSSISTDVISKQSSHISELPVSLLKYILRWVVSDQLDFVSLEKCSMVCKGMYLCARDEEIWRSGCIRVWGDSVGTPGKPGGNQQAGQSIQYKCWRDMYISRPRVLFNGCYICKTTYLRLGENCFPNSSNQLLQSVGYFRYIRFLPDGIMYMMTSTDPPISGVNKLRNLNQMRPEVLRGQYSVKGDVISCMVQKHPYQLSQQQQKRHMTTVQNSKDKVVYGDESENVKFHIELQIANTPKRKSAKLNWLSLKFTDNRKDKETSTSSIGIEETKFRPFIFSPVHSYRLTIPRSPLI